MKVEQQTEKLVPDTSNPTSFLIKVTFFAFGVSSISGWNAVLTALDYLGKQYEGFEVNFYFPVPVFLSTCLIGFLLPKLSLYLSLTFRIAWALVVVCVVLTLVAMVAKYFPNATGFWVTIFLLALLGSFNSSQQNSSIAIASILGGDAIGPYWLGTGFSGTIICVFRMICLAALPGDDALGAIIYFIVAAAWNIGSVLLYIRFMQTPEYDKILCSYMSIKESQVTIAIEEAALNYSQVSSEPTLAASPIAKQTINRMNILEIVVFINKVIFPIPFYIILIYIQTFMMFPGMTLKKGFSDDWVAWGTTLLIFTYNAGDTIGKYLSGFRKMYNECILTTILILRFGFFVLFYMIVKKDIEANWFAFGNLLLFSILNGLLTGGYMQIGPEKVEDFLKEKVGFVSGFSLVFGIMLGTFLALPLANIN